MEDSRVARLKVSKPVIGFAKMDFTFANVSFLFDKK